MKPFRGIALAMAGVSIAVLGLSISIIGQTIAQVGSTNFEPGVFLGALVATIGAVISLISALVFERVTVAALYGEAPLILTCSQMGSCQSNSRYSYDATRFLREPNNCELHFCRLMP